MNSAVNAIASQASPNGSAIDKRSERLARAKSVTKLAIGVNSFLATSKALVGIWGNSYILIADAVESLTDVLGSLVVWGGLTVASRPPSEKYPYGRGRAETIATLFVGMLLSFSAAAIAWGSVQEIRTPHQLPEPFTLVFLILVILLKEGLFRFAFDVGGDVGSAAVKADAWHHRSDALTSAAAFLGISAALLAGPGYESADDWAALFVSGIILMNAYAIVRPALSEILDSAPDKRVQEEIRMLAQSVPGVMGTHKCYIRKAGLEFFVDLDVLVSGEMSVKESHELAHQVQDLVREALPFVSKVLIHVEPFLPPSQAS